MNTLLQKQYLLVQSSRDVVLSFIDTRVGNDLNTPVPAFNNQPIRYFLVHNADCYFHWLAYFGMKQPAKLINSEDFTNVDLIRQLYTRADDIAAAFLESFKDKMEVPVEGHHNRAGLVSATPLQLFTHVTTHEFHHKGQIMTMCRMLGYIPPDTDAIRF
ncbi:DinB family protein [Mucilaginibacter sp.]|uniref:DinB family protein n=1 Tax=Mucilaginibacter sp. TaxID=1882438 RepID=UPI00283C6D44|nr:DinB family protein [Mucilaginibacter sp.]MDR3693948.1 DinB family protein [Mucilaginibacter sp.]